MSGGSVGGARVGLFIDFQNIHLTARDVFAPPATSAQDTLIHPVLFAERVLALRASESPEDVLSKIVVFRGVPSNARQPRLYGAAQAQRANWSRDKRVQVEYRTLRYSSRAGDPPREKGVDVQLAIEVVRAAHLREDLDVVIVATHDTDLEPAITMATESQRVVIETAGWRGCRRLRAGVRLRHTTLDAADFVATRDRRDYWGPR